MNPVMIFVLSVGRSGSTSVAKAYGLEHEPDGRHPDVRLVMARSTGRLIYGETSPFWRRHLGVLHKAFPAAHYVHLVRNGKDVVSSIMNRAAFTYREGAHEDENEAISIYGFETLPRFEKVCHYWRFWNERIEKWVDNRVRLEDLTGLPHENRGLSHQKWDWKERKTFDRICGPIMARYGYTQ